MYIYYVYITLNNVNGKRYIGKHRYNDECGKPDDYLGSGVALNKAIKKYGVENFTKKIIEVCDSEKDAYEAETYWVDFFDAVNSNDFYNEVRGGHGWQPGQQPWNKGKKTGKQSEEARKNESDAHEKKPVACFDIKTGKLVKVYEGVRAVEKDGYSPRAVCTCCKFNTKGKTHYGFIWLYLDEYNSNPNIVFERIKIVTPKRIVCLDNTTGDIIKIYENSGCVKEDGFATGSVTSCCKGRNNTHKGYRWMYLDDYNSQYEILNLFQMCR